MTTYEFDCTRCGDNCATHIPDLKHCDACWDATSCCDLCDRRVDQVINWDGRSLCTDCDDEHGYAAFAHYRSALAAFHRPAPSLADFNRAQQVGP